MFYSKQGTFIDVKTFKKIKEKFELKNLKKVQQQRMWFWGWQKMPTYNKHWRKVNINWTTFIQVPAGIRWFWGDKFEDKYWEVKHIDFPELNNLYKWNELDLKQDKLVSELLENNVGLAWASTWVWKTFITAKIIKSRNVKTLIIVPNLTLMKQMQKDLKDIFWVKYRTLSWSKTKQKDTSDDIIIANIDTLVKQDRNFFESFDLTICDEVDTYLWSEKRQEIMGYSLTTKWIYWLTWTIKVNYIPDEIFSIYFWPRSELILKNFTPEITKIYTWFKSEVYHSEEYSDYDGGFDMKYFHLLKKELYENENRNKLIVETVIDTIWDRKWIVFCEYIEHSKLIQEKLEIAWIKTFLLIWEVSKEDRERITKELKEHKWKCILIGSVQIIGRWFNVPELSVWYLTTSEKFTSNISQYVGRIIRQFPWKTWCEWYDFVDDKTQILFNQSKARTTTYKKEFPWCKIYVQNLY